MSGSARQAGRAGIREGAGNGSSNPTNAAAAATFSDAPPIPSLTPDGEAIKKLLQGQQILKKAPKYKVVQDVFAVREQLSQQLEGITAGSSAKLEAIQWNATANGSKLKAQATYGADALGALIYDLRHALQSLLPSSRNFAGLQPAALKNAIISVHNNYEMARHNATHELQSKFSSQFISLTGAQKDRKYLQAGYLPTDGTAGSVTDLAGAGMAKCLCCAHGWCDEPNTNLTVAQGNLLLRRQYERQCAEDERTRASGGQVLTSHGVAMQEGRKRKEPSYASTMVVCHCAQFGCDTAEGVVPPHKCPIGCIDSTTGQRFTFDALGMCLCPICACNCRRAYTTSAHQAFLANTMVAENGGQANVSNPPPTRHRPPANVQGNFHATAAAMGDVMRRHGHAAVQGALITARSNLQAGLSAPSLDTTLVGEQMALFAGREMAETMHGDSAGSRMLAQFAAAAGPPTNFTNLPGTGQLFSSRTIPSSGSEHRQHNNRLVPMTGNNRRAVPGTALAGTRGQLFPEGVNTIPFRSAAASGASSTASRSAAASGAAATSRSAAASGAAAASRTSTEEVEQRDYEYERAVTESIETFNILQAAREDMPPSTTPHPSTASDGRKRAADPPLVTEQKKPPARKKPSARTVESQLLGAVDSALASFDGKAPGKPSLPPCLDGVDTDFFTKENSTTPIPSGGHDAISNINDVVDLNTPEEEASAVDVVDVLVARSFQRSFNEANVDGDVVDVDVAAAATQRVNMIAEKPGKARMLVSAYYNQASQLGREITSPAVNAMLDKFIGN